MHLHTSKQQFTFLAFILFLLFIAVSHAPSFASSMEKTAVNYIVQAADAETAKTAVSQVGAPITHELGIINAVTADLTATQYEHLASQDLHLYENTAVQSASTSPTSSLMVALHSGKCLTVPSSSQQGGENLTQYSCTDNDNQQWVFEDIGGAYMIKAVHSEQCLAVPGSSTHNGTNIIQYYCHNDWADQHWQIIAVDDGYQIKNVATGKCLDVPGASRNNDSPIIQWTCHSGDNQIWQINAMALGGDANPNGAAHADLSVRDEFNTVSFYNNDGTTSWDDGWWDPREGQDGPASGLIQVTNGYLQIAGSSNELLRTIIMKDSVSATLSFRYKRDFANSSDHVRVYFRPTPSSDVARVITIQGVHTDTDWQQATIDLTTYLKNTGQAYLSFFTSSSFSNDSSLKVDDVELNFTTYAPDVDYPTLVNANAVHAQGITGANIGVAVLDTGMGYEGNVFFDSDNWSYNISGMRVPAIYDAIHDSTTTDFFAKLDATDASGHGTHIGSIIASSQNNNENGRKNGVAPKAKIIPVRAFNSNGNATYADVIRGIDWIVANKDSYNIRVINASFFSEPRAYYWEDPLNQALMQAWQAGIVVVASAGNIPAANNHAMTIGAPGNIPYIITVGGMTDAYTPNDPTDDKILSFSAMGPTAAQFIKPDIVAPGGHVRSYMPENSSLVTQHPHLFDQGDYFTMSGTSQSAAVVSGIVALMLDANPNLTPDNVKCRLMTSAHAAVDANGNLAAPIYAQGAGLVNAYDAVNSTATGCANQGLDIAADLAGTHHFVGHVAWEDSRQEFVIYNNNGDVIEGVAWNGGNGFMSGGNGFMSGGNGFMSGGNGFMSGGNGFMSGGNGFMSGGNGFMSGGNGFMSGTTPWNASITWDANYSFNTASMDINTWVDPE